jgi:hypothetical protein
LHDLGLAVELEVTRLRHGQLAIDQPLQRLALGLRALLRRNRLLGEQGADLVDRDLFLVDPGGRLRGRWLLGAAAREGRRQRPRRSRSARPDGKGREGRTGHGRGPWRGGLAQPRR